MANLLKQFGRNIMSSWASLGVRILLVFFVNPFIIHTLGNEQYGIWILVISIINYLTILDFGLKQSLIRYVSKYLGSNNYKKINGIVNTIASLYFIVGSGVIILTLLLSYFAVPLLNLPEESLSDARMVLLIIGMSTAINYVFIARSDSHGAFHRYDISYGLAIFEDILRTITIIWLLKSGHGIIQFASAYLIFNLIRNLIGAGIARKMYPFLKLRFFQIDPEILAELKKYSIIGFFISVVWLFIVNTDNIIIARFFDPESITLYSIAAGFIVYLRLLVLTIAFPLRPLISHYESKNRFEHIRFIYTAGTKYLYAGAFLLAGLTVIYADPFIALWMGPGYEISAEIMILLIIPAAFFVPQIIANSIFYGVGKLQNLFYLLLIEGIANLILSLVLLHYFGLKGIAYGTAIPQIIIHFWAVPIIMKKMLGFNIIKYYLTNCLIMVSFFGSSFIAAYYMTSFINPDSWVKLVGGILPILLIIPLVWYIVSDKNELKEILSKFKRGQT